MAEHAESEARMWERALRNCQAEWLEEHNARLNLERRRAELAEWCEGEARGAEEDAQDARVHGREVVAGRHRVAAVAYRAVAARIREEGSVEPKHPIGGGPVPASERTRRIEAERVLGGLADAVKPKLGTMNYHFGPGARTAVGLEDKKAFRAIQEGVESARQHFDTYGREDDG